MSSEPKAPGAPAIILFRQVNRDDSNPKIPHEYSCVRVKSKTEVNGNVLKYARTYEVKELSVER